MFLIVKYANNEVAEIANNLFEIIWDIFKLLSTCQIFLAITLHVAGFL